MTYFSHIDNMKIHFDKKLDNLFNKKNNGFFIELGAFDGIFQSNTYFFEKNRDWSGILIEPSHNMYQKCLINRPKSIVLNYACVSNKYLNKKIKGDFNGKPISSINSMRRKNNKLIEVNAITLTKILDKYKDKFKNIDLLSLDTEGYELNILKGLNFQKYRPNYLLIEIYNKAFEKILNFLKSQNYKLICNFSNYNKKDNPGWDGTHNDYLFQDNLI